MEVIKMPLNIPANITIPEREPNREDLEDLIGSNRVLLAIPKVIPPMAKRMMPIPDVIPPMQVCAEANEENLEP
jgi:hypothetical protein